MSINVYSAQDCRSKPLFPCICGDNGAVQGFGVENYVHHRHEIATPGVPYPHYECRCVGTCYTDPYPHYKCVCVGCWCDICGPEGPDVPFPHYCGCFYCGCYGDPYPVYDCICIGCYPGPDAYCYRYYMELENVPVQFKRLGPKSRALVMSLYRALVERFFIMRATGCACERPTNVTCGFGFDSLFLASNDCLDKRALAGENQRRAFGGTFREAIKDLVSKYTDTGVACSRCGVYFYPFTPYSENLCFASTFLPCAKEYANGQPINWWQTTPYNAAFFKILGDSCSGGHDALWTLDNSMQRDLSYNLSQANSLRPLLKDIAAAYRTYMTAQDCICSYIYTRLRCDLPSDRLKSISTCYAALNCICGIDTFMEAINRFALDPYFWNVSPRFTLPALAIALRMLSPLNAQTVSRGANVTIPHKRITANFTLPIGTSDGRFVIGPERSCFRICDVNLQCAVTCARLTYFGGFASYHGYESYFNLEDREWPPEYCCRETEVPVYRCVCVGTCYTDPYPHYKCVCVGCWCDECAVPYPHYQCICIGCYGDPYPHWDYTVSPPVYCGCYCDPCSAYPHHCSVYCGCYGDPYPHYCGCFYCGCYCDPYSVFECVCVGTCTYRCQVPYPNRDYVCATCILRWNVRTCAIGRSDEHCASVTMRAIWPNLSGGGFQFGGAAYPARWAVLECDVAFGAVSAFVKGATSDKRAWVVNKTDRPRHTLGVCKDLMSVLGRGLIKAGLQRALCDQDTCCFEGNTFEGTNFPTTANAAAFEMVGENHDKNLEVIRCAAAGSGGGGGGLHYLSYHHLRVAGCGAVFAYYNAEETGGGMEIVPSTRWFDGKWLHLGSSGGGSIAFGYDRDYEKTSGCGGCGGYCCDCCSCGGGSGYTSTCVRHGWNLPRTSVQFGGFFGTFIFNNRAARQS